MPLLEHATRTTARQRCGYWSSVCAGMGRRVERLRGLPGHDVTRDNSGLGATCIAGREMRVAVLQRPGVLGPGRAGGWYTVIMT